MPFESMREKLHFTPEEIANLVDISRSRTHPLREVERAKILLASVEGMNDSQIAVELHTNRHKVIRTIKKALAYGLEDALKDLPRTGHPKEISSEARAWIISIACMKPKELGYPHEIWTQRLLADHIRENCNDNRFEELSNISQGTVSKILNAGKIKPHKIISYIEKRDPDFDSKSAVVLHTYKQVEIIKNKVASGEEVFSAIISYDEKPGIAALGTTAPDLPPKPGEYPAIARDYEYIRHGTISLLAGIDLLTGNIYHKIFENHRSKEFVEFLKYLDDIYPSQIKITIILDNLRVHTSKETANYLSSVPNRFDFVFTPKHASWLNIVESLFSKMARSMLRGIRVASIDELKSRINEYFEYLNKKPTIFTWSYKMDEMPGGISI
jgi:transposase